jgi:hypothetical protein
MSGGSWATGVRTESDLDITTLAVQLGAPHSAERLCRPCCKWELGERHGTCLRRRCGRRNHGLARRSSGRTET